MQFFFVRASAFSYVAYLLSLFVPQLFYFCCLMAIPGRTLILVFNPKPEIGILWCALKKANIP